MESKINDMEKAIKILESELAQRKLANTINHLRKDEVEEEIKSLEKALAMIKDCVSCEEMVFDIEDGEEDEEDMLDSYAASHGLDSYELSRQPGRNNY